MAKQNLLSIFKWSVDRQKIDVTQQKYNSFMNVLCKNLNSMEVEGVSNSFNFQAQEFELFNEELKNAMKESESAPVSEGQDPWPLNLYLNAHCKKSFSVFKGLKNDWEGMPQNANLSYGPVGPDGDRMWDISYSDLVTVEVSDLQESAQKAFEDAVQTDSLVVYTTVGLYVSKTDAESGLPQEVVINVVVNVKPV